MNVKNDVKIFYPACGHDFWNGGGLGGSLRLIRQAMNGNGPISDKIPTSLDVVYCDINPEITIHKIKRVIDILMGNQINNSRTRYFSEAIMQLNFNREPDVNLPFGGPEEWKTFVWMYELVGELNGINIRFRYFSTSYQQTMFYLWKHGWKLEKDDVILLGSNWRYYGEGGQNLHTIFEHPLSQFFDNKTKLITRYDGDIDYRSEEHYYDFDYFTLRRFSQGFWEYGLIV